MRRIAVLSSDIASVGYDVTSNTLEVEFNSCSVYQYFDVPRCVHEGLMNAESHGKYFDAYIKKGGYRYKKIY